MPTTEYHFNRTHGGTNTPEFYAWQAMLQRCNNPKNKDFVRWGARGIRVCDRWLHSFENFIADVGKRPTSQHSIDRFPNNNGNYEPGNVRWATPKEQTRNQRNNRLVTFGGVTQPLSAWAEAHGLRRNTLRRRIEAGWPLDLAFNTVPSQKWNWRIK